MLKKIFLTATVAAFALTACDTDSSTSAKNDEPPVETSTKPSDTTSVNNNSEGVVYDTIRTPAYDNENASGLGCSIRETSANSFVMTIVEDSVTSTITTILMGKEVDLTYVSVYDEAVSEERIQDFCEENNQLPAWSRSIIECDGHTMTIRENDETEMTFEQILASAKSTCAQMNVSINPNSSYEPVVQNPPKEENPVVQEPSDEIQVPTDPTRATCQITEKTTTTFKMIVTQPDSGSIYTSYEYKNGILVTEVRFDFMMTMPLALIDGYCAEAKADAIEMAEDEGVEVDVKCEPYRIAETITETTSMNVVPYLAKEMVEYCNEIQRTGVIPEGDEDEDDF